MLMNEGIRKELLAIETAIQAAGAPALGVREVRRLRRTFDEIPELKEALKADLLDLATAIDRGEIPALQGNPALVQNLAKAMQLLESPGGPPGIGDNLTGGGGGP